MDDNKPQNNSGKAFSMAFALGWEMGYTIAVPLVIFAIIGRFADRYMGTSPFLFLAGIILSIFISIFLLYRKFKQIIKDQEEDEAQNLKRKE